jgi:hypothetical protein
MAKEDLIPFKKGYDPKRNVTGANKGSRSLTTLLREALQVIGKGQKDPYAELLVKKVMKMAIADGNEQMIKLCWNYLEGLPKETHALEGNITINFDNAFASTPKTDSK